MRPIFSVEYYQQVGHDEHYLHASQTLTVMPLMRYYPEHRLFGGTARHDKAVDSLLEATLFIHSGAAEPSPAGLSICRDGVENPSLTISYRAKRKIQHTF